MEKTVTGTSSLVTFTNSQGVPCRGTLIYLTRQQAVFEVYNPYSVVQLSEVLSPFCILRGERTIYNGRGVVINLVPTGLMLIVSVTLVDAWSDLTGLEPGRGLREETQHFVEDWESAQTLQPSFQAAVARLRSFLEELSRWLQGAEQDRPSDTNSDHAFIEEINSVVSPKLNGLFGSFEEEGAKLTKGEHSVHKAFTQRELHALTLCSPWMYRCFSKPLGYAGDYEMLNMILRDWYDGPSAYAKIINHALLRTAPPKAYKNRITMLVERLVNETKRVNRFKNRPIKALSVGCGPVNELDRFIREETISGECEFLLMDFNQPTLDFTRNRIVQLMRETGRHVKATYIQKSINDLLEEAKGRKTSFDPVYDLVYCAGLFDYFSDRICARLIELFYSWVNPGGLVVVTNVENSNPILYSIEFLMEWHLIYRNGNNMLALTPQTGVQSISSDQTGINIFLEIRKPESRA